MTEGGWMVACFMPQQLTWYKMRERVKKIVDVEEKNLSFLFGGSFGESIFHLKMGKMFEYFPANSFAKEYYSSTNLC